jgi:protein involved in polysaccharide export with SLBB domain
LIGRPSPEEELIDRQKGESDDRTPKTYVISLDELLVKGDFRLNRTLNHGDVINVPVSGKIFVGGEVMKPGGFPMKGKKITVSQAVAMAEGLRPEASGSEAKIIRDSGNSAEREVLPVDVYAIQKGEGEDPYLKENDILIVPRSGTKAFFLGLRDTLRGILSFGYSFGTL